MTVPESDPNNQMDELTDDEIVRLKTALRSLNGEARGQLGPHLKPETLEFYHLQKLSSELVEQTQDHLVACPDCATLLLELVEFCDAPVSVKLTSAEVAPVSPGLPSQDHSKARDDSLFQRVKPSWLSRVGTFFASQRFVYAAAALLLAVTLLLGLWIASLKLERRELEARLNQQEGSNQGYSNAQRVLEETTRKIQEVEHQRDQERIRAKQLEERAAQLEAEVTESRSGNNSSRVRSRAVLQPGANVPVVGLTLEEQRSVTSPPIIDLPKETKLFTLAISDPSPNQTYGEYEIEIRKPDGLTIRRERGLRLQSALGGVLTIGLPATQLPAGEYRITAYGISSGKRALVSESSVEVRYH